MSDMPRDHQQLLEQYRRKRRSDGTPEPFGRAARTAGGPLGFVVHHHAARNTHFDLRLEMEGVLRSWAVPRGPSPNMEDKRFAALVEDHPLEYGDFEGRIPDGNYGAGWTIVWDRGIWIPRGDPVEGMEKGKLLFELRGQKLRGSWTLVRMKSGERDWLFIKERDDQARADAGTDDYPMNSVFSGLSLEDLDAGRDVEAELVRRIARSRARKRRVTNYKPMLADTGEAFNRKGWVFEIKYDGYRLMCIKDGPDTRLLSRNGNDLSAVFPEIADAVSRLPFSGIIIDGEAVCHDAGGMPSFARIQQRGRLDRPSAIARAMRDNPATLYAFDLPALADYDLRELPLVKRKEYLRAALPDPGMIRYSEHIERDGDRMYEAARQLGLEGIVAKKADSVYRHERSGKWIKIRVDRTDDFVIMGYRRTETGKLRSLMLGQYVGSELVYSGNVGSGLDTKLSRELESSLSGREDMPRPADAPEDRDLCWKTPDLVCEVRFKEITPAGQLRHPVFLRLRDDKPPEACRRQVKTRSLPEVEVQEEPVEKHVELSNLDKVFWPDEGYTKGDLIEYYDAVSPWILPWLKDRPLVMTRFPDGIDGKSFFQKDAPEFVPNWIHIEKMWSESTERDIGYFVVDDRETLIYIANMASIPLHIYHSRTQNIEKPDWCVLDLDPKDAPFEDVVTVAKAIHKLCDEIGLPNYVKTSGSTGLHVLIPLNRTFTFEQSRTLGELLARVIAVELPDISTVTRNPSKRGGKVYIDYLQNGSGKLIAAPYCVRPKPGAPVSMPLRWREVTKKLRPDSYTIRNAMARLGQIKEDPAIGVLTDKPDLAAALDDLTERYARS